MRSFLVTGGTDGIGGGVALDALGKGHRVIAVGGTAEKGDRFLAAAEAAGAADRAEFVRADLRLVSDNQRVLDLVADRFERLDRLVLCAQRYRTRLTRTAEGVEENFAISYLSRYMLSMGLVRMLGRAPEPAVFNVCGTGTTAGRMNWDDLQFENGGRGFKALMQSARASDLLGVAFADDDRTHGIPFVLFNPDGVRTNLQRELGQPFRLLATVTLALHGKPLAEGIRPLVALIEDPPGERLTAFRADRPVDMRSPKFKDYYRAVDAARLREATERLLTGLAQAEPR
jgi:NAD(P)-dependent dehydrogenase (short-subunit alcohol dehydrogenase family)